MAYKGPPKAPKKKRPSRLKEASRGQLRKMRRPTEIRKHASKAFFFGYSFGFAAGSIGFAFVSRIIHNDASELELYLNYWVIKLLGSFMLGLFLALLPAMIFNSTSQAALAKAKVIAKTGDIPGRGGFVTGLAASGSLVFLSGQFVAISLAVIFSLALPPLTASWWAQTERKKQV
jgi:hypothetical protein